MLDIKRFDDQYMYNTNDKNEQQLFNPPLFS